MELSIYKDHEELSDAAANEIVRLLRNKPDALLCLASGETPRLTCRLLVQKVREQEIDTRQFTFIGLDEWVGIPPGNEGSCAYFFKTELIQPLGLSTEQVALFNSMSDDLPGECRRMDALIREKGGIDLVLVGLGMNGHIGFNEPGVSFDHYSHVIPLDETTITVGQKYFKTATRLEKGITLGLKHLQEAKKVLLLANGIKKAEVIRQTVKGAVSNSFPATIMQTLSHGRVMADREAASLLEEKK